MQSLASQLARAASHGVNVQVNQKPIHAKLNNGSLLLNYGPLKNNEKNQNYKT